jgi:hypothetical protein
VLGMPRTSMGEARDVTERDLAAVSLGQVTGPPFLSATSRGLQYLSS